MQRRSIGVKYKLEPFTRGFSNELVYIFEKTIEKDISIGLLVCLAADSPMLRLPQVADH